MKEHERLFFIVCMNVNRIFKRHTVLITLSILKGYIPRKRMEYYLLKWSNLGFYEYGVYFTSGWFNLENLPQRYLDLYKTVC